MLSEEMYKILKLIPRQPNAIGYSKIQERCTINGEVLFERICEAMYSSNDYINCSSLVRSCENISLTEKGRAAIEEYERALRNDEYVAQSAKGAKAANKAAIASAIMAGISLLISVLPHAVTWLNSIGQ